MQARDVQVAYASGSLGTLTMAGGALTANSLILTNANAYFVFDGGNLTTQTGLVSNGRSIIVGNEGRTANWTMNSGLHQLGNELVLGNPSGSTGTVFMTGGQLLTGGNPTYIGFDGVGRMTVTNGIWQAQIVYLGHNAGSSGSLTLGGVVSQSQALVVGEYGNGSVLMTGGQLVIPEGWYTLVGYYGTGQMTISNGTCLGYQARIGAYSGSQGTLTIAGGNSSLSDKIYIGYASSATGQVNITGGNLTVAAGIFVGNSGVGTLTISGGVVTSPSPSYVGYNTNGVGTLRVAGGSFVGGDLHVGAQGQGQLVVSNGTATIGSYLYLADGPNSSGTITVNGGTLSVGTLIENNSAGSRVAIEVNGGLMQIAGDAYLGQTGTSTVMITNGKLMAYGATYLGDSGVGTITVNGGTLNMANLQMYPRFGGQSH